METLKQINDFIGLLSGMTTLQKVISSSIIILLTVILLSSIWIKSINVNDKDTFTAIKLNNLSDAINRANIEEIKRYISTDNAYTQLSWQHREDASLLINLQVEGVLFDVVVIPKLRPYNNAPAVIMLLKFLNPKRSLFAPENEEVLQLTKKLFGNNQFKGCDKIEEAIAAREDYRLKLGGFYMCQVYMIGGRRDAMSKSEIENAASMNANQHVLQIVTYDTFSEMIKN